mmetsp:Transcript_13011/g.21305  ORF Transcript_13011/g.21305 Transcript_13011/m.21305 type:complete len:234 (+) Transcript_13011:319-1020(+)
MTLHISNTSCNVIMHACMYVCMLGGGYEVCIALLELDSQLQQLSKCRGKVIKEGLLVLCIQSHNLLKLLVPYQSHIGRQHHQFARWVLVLKRAIPLLLGPLVVHKFLVVVVAECSRGACPGAYISTAIFMTSAKGMCTNQSDHFAISETHTAKYVSHMFLCFGGIRKTSIGRGSGVVWCIRPSRPPWYRRATHLLNGNSASQGPKICITNPRVLRFNWLQENTGMVKTGIGAM